MVMRVYFKISRRLLLNQITRLITIIAIVAVSLSIISGIGEVKNTIDYITQDFYNSQNISDLYFKSTKSEGFSEDEINTITSRFGEDNIMKSFCVETKVDEEIIRVCYFNVNDININKLRLIDGSLPLNENDVFVERSTNQIKGYNLKDKISLLGTEYEVSGVVLNPLNINKLEAQSFIYANENLDNVVYIFSDNLPMVNDIFVTLKQRDLFKSFSDEYKEEIDKIKFEMQSVLNYDDVKVLSLYENNGLYALNFYAEKVELIGLIFILFFLLVTLLVVYSTMSRLLNEERKQIACLKTLGYSNLKIINIYVWFVILATMIGGFLSFGVGRLLTSIIYSAFNLQHTMPLFPKIINYGYYLVTFLIILSSLSILTYITGRKIIKNKPVMLLNAKSPKAGKKVIFERFTLIWNRLSFKYKSTLRNVLLFKSRLFMTVISIMGATVLVFAGMGLFDSAVTKENSFSLVTISGVLIVFSAILCALIIYNITNINVSERTREIATLMVLGYNNKEVTGYIYREIYIMCFLGTVLGIPLGVAFLEFVYGLTNFGSVSDINWYTWLLAPFVTMLFSFLSTRLLYRRIVKTDMNASLKSIE